MSSLIDKIFFPKSKLGQQPGIQRGLFISFSFALLSMVLLTGLVLYLGRQVQTVEFSISETRLILNHLDKLRYEMLNRESLTRGFVATGDVAFLSDGNEKMAIHQRVQQLDLLIGESREPSHSLFEKLKTKIEAKLKFGDLEIALTKSKGTGAAQAQMRTREGLHLGNEIRGLLAKIEAIEEVTLADERRQRGKNINAILGLSFLGSCGAFWILFYSFFRLRKQIQQLSIAEERSNSAFKALQNLVDAVKDPLLILGADLRIVGAGKSFYDTFKADAAKTKGQLVYEIGNREWDVPQFRTILGRVISGTEDTADFELTNTILNLGEKTWLVTATKMESGVHGLPRILVSLKDISGRKEAENKTLQANIELWDIKNRLEEKVQERTQELRTQEELLKQAISVAKLGIFKHNLITGEIYFSDSCRQIYGWNAEKSYSFEEWSKIVHPDDLNEILKDIREGQDPKGNGMIAIDHRICSADGSIRWMSTKAKTFFEGEWPERRALHTVGCTIDITERKKYEEIIKKTLASLIEEKSKLADSNKSLERFASVAAHDLRAPIRSIGLWIDMLEQWIPHPLETELKRALEFLKLNSSKSSALIDDLLEIAKVTPKYTETHPVDLKQVVEQILSSYKDEIETRRLKVTLGELPTITGNAVQWESVLGNLIRNALLYQDRNKTGEIQIWTEEVENFYHLFVRDNGIGIAPQYQQKIFEMFERLHTDSEYPGTGIGLALCKKIVHGWGGQICLDSEPGKGSTFCVSYPKEIPLKERKTA